MWCKDKDCMIKTKHMRHPHDIDTHTVKSSVATKKVSDDAMTVD